MWDELAAAAWIDPSIITKRETRFMGAWIWTRARHMGIRSTWSDRDKPKVVGPPVEIQTDLDRERFYRMFVTMKGPIRAAH